MKSPKKKPLRSTPAFIFIIAFIAILIAVDLYFIAAVKHKGKDTQSQTSSSVQQSSTGIR